MALSFGSFYFQISRVQFPTFPSEVLAEDRKAKVQPAAPPANGSTPNQNNEIASGPTEVPDIVSHLERREAELKRKEEQLNQKEKYLAHMEKEVEKKLKELTTMQKEVQAYRSEKEEVQNAKVRSLAKIYGSMKPKEAAKLLENLEDPLVVNVISTMTPEEAATIMANMDVKKAAKISESLSKQ
ncbi:MAG: MotE family protein [Syntrophobacteraceae bacterium]